METIPKADCEKIGFFRKTHGVNGELVLEFENQFEESIINTNRFFVELEGLLVPFFISEDGFRFKTDNTALIIFSDVESEQYARRLVGKAVYLFKEEIIPSDEIFDSELEGFLLFDTKLGEIGKIDEVNNYSGNIVLAVRFKEKELLIPYNEDFLVSINKKAKQLEITIPEGIIE